MEENVKVPIKAKDAKIGGTYRTEMKRVVTVIAINKFGEGEDDVSSVSIKGEGSATPIPVSAQTLLYEVDPNEIVKTLEGENSEVVEGGSEVKVAKVKKEKVPKEPRVKKEKVKKEPKHKMSHIMNDMIIAGEKPEVIADAVIAAFPEQADRRQKLIMLIKGPRTWNLKKKYPEKFPEILTVNPDTNISDAPQPPIESNDPPAEGGSVPEILTVNEGDGVSPSAEINQ